MYVYEFQAKGRYLGAVIVVVASTRAAAVRKARAWCLERALDPSTIRENGEPKLIEKAFVAYAWDGDY